MDYLSTLNPRQRAAVEHFKGPLLIIAGAGSGKTRVLTYRIAHLIYEHQIPPYRILAVTFTNKAAQEMKERVIELIGPAGEQVWMSTFHSTCVQILRFDGDKIGFGSNFQIFDTSDQLQVIKDCLKELNLDPKKFDPRAVLATISKAKNVLLSPEEYKGQAGDFFEKTVGRVYEKYQGKLRENKAMDFDDLIMHTVTLFRNEPEVLAKYQGRFQYIMVDEYQDTNHAQYVLINLLAKGLRNICVVGDEDQSIYAFRGADIRNILDFEKDYPEAKLIKLEENYRSTCSILETANQLIKNNSERKDKNLWTGNPQGEKVKFYQAADERQEASFVADIIKKGTRSPQEYTILYRTHAQSRTFEEEFIRRGIPYRIVSGTRFYERKEIKDLLAYLRLINNPEDSYSLRRIINVPKRGIGDTTVAKVDDFAQAHGLSLFDALDHVASMPKVSGKYAKALTEFKQLIDSLRDLLGEVSLSALAEKVLLASGYKEHLSKQSSIEAEARIENLTEFLSVAKQFEIEQGEVDLGMFLEHVALISDVDNFDRGADVVNMMSLHAAKGLEFPVVFLVGMEDGIFPHSRSLWEPGQLEEERRLAYVGITRAQQELYLTCAGVRTMYGQVSSNPVSCFVKELPQGMLEEVGVTKKKQPSVSKRHVSPNNGGDYQVGDKVRHSKFGEGMIVSISGAGNDAILSIAFPDQEIKKLLAGYAPLEKI